MLRVRSTKQELHCQKCEVLTSDTLLVTKRIPMIVVNLFLLLPLQLLKQHLPLLTWAKTYISWMPKFTGAYVVNCHSSCNSCADLGAMFQVMFSDSKIASQFKLGKTKARYAMLYGIALELKKQLIYDINATPFYTVSFDESLNSQVQVSQMDVGVLYWNSRKSIAETHYFDSNFM